MYIKDIKFEKMSTGSMCLEEACDSCRSPWLLVVM